VPDERHNVGDLLRRLGRAAERRMAVGRLAHRGVAAALAEAREVECPGVETARIPVVEPAAVAEIEADRQRRREGGAVDIEDGSAAGRLAADEQRRPVICRGEPEGLLGHAGEIGALRLPSFRPKPKELIHGKCGRRGGGNVGRIA
jgi:hypothetical protein